MSESVKDGSCVALDIERRVLSTLLCEEKARDSITKVLVGSFYLAEHRSIYAALKKIHLNRQPVDMVYMMENYGDGISPLTLVELWNVDKIFDREMFEWAIVRLKELYYLRISLELSNRISVATQTLDIVRTAKLANSITKSYHALLTKNIKLDVIEDAVAVINSSDEYIPFSSPLCHAKYGGWTRKDLSSVGGKSGHNKTTFAIFDATESLKKGFAHKILYFAVDEPGEMIVRRVIANDLDISLSAMRSKTITLNVDEVRRALSAIYADRFVVIDDTRSADDISQAIMDIKPDRAIVDHIQELDYGEDGISDQKVMVAAGKLKHAAKIAGANVTVLSQVRDKLIDERFEDKIPRPHDFLYASDLRRKSREQTVVYWEYKDSQDEMMMDIFDFIVWKSTYSETGKVKFAITPDKARFSEQLFTRDATNKPHTEADLWEKLNKS